MDESLSYTSLFAGAKKFALSAWSAHNRHSNDREIFLLHAGVSIERLAKAALAKQSPILLMETNAKEDLLLYFAGATTSIESRIRTIGASAAIIRLRKLGILSQKDPDLDGLIELRNGVAHLSAQSTDEFDPVVTFARTTTELLEHLGEDPESYWGQMASFPKIVLDKAQSEIEKQIALRIRSAQHRFEERFYGLQSDAIETYRSAAATLGTRLTRVIDDVYLSQSRTCPACKCPAILDAKLLIKTASEHDIMFEVVILSCKHCNLVIEGREFLKAADVEHEIPLPIESMQRRHYFWHFMREDNPNQAELLLAKDVFNHD